MTRLSNRQYPMLKQFAEGQIYMSIAQAQKFDQRPFRSMLIQEWIEYKPGKGFHITDKGLKAWDEFRFTAISRKNPDMPLTRYFDPVAYGLKLSPKKANVHVMPKRGRAA